MNKTVIAIIGFFILITGAVNAQSTSTYTRSGVGDIIYSYSARSLSLGHSGSALINKDYIAITNPAGWSSLAKTRIEFSFVYNGMNISNSTDSKFYGDGDFKGFTFAFPVSEEHGIGVATGLVPYSRMNYLVEQDNEAVSSSSSNYTATYQGKGGLSKLFIGSTYKFPFDLVFGGTLEYYFGNLKYLSKVEFENTSTFPAEYEMLYAPTGFGTSIGFISPDLSGLLNSESFTNLKLAVSANIISELDTDTLLTSRSSSIVDTLGIGVTKMNVPTKITVGATVTVSNNFTFNLDYFYQPWSDYKLNETKSVNLKDAQKVSFGFEYRPTRALGMSYWEQIMLRFGLSYEQSQYTYYGKDINQYSVFGGFSLPLSYENTIDFAVEYSIRGTAEANLIQEKFIRINLGLSFGDIWFQRYEK
ncbi:MAG: hypothetical protein V3V72_00685 [Ignavibacteriaceae bacterium]